MKAQVQYLGHLLSGNGIEPVPDKLESLKAMVRPTNPKGIKQYLGFVGYYRKFIPKYSDIAKPLTELTKLDITFEWTEECQKAYDLLKEYLLKEPVLKYPDPELPYILYVMLTRCLEVYILTVRFTITRASITEARRCHNYKTQSPPLPKGGGGARAI